MKKVTILGDGAWGSAVATLVANNGYDVTLWCYHKEIAQEINQSSTNHRYLPDIIFPKNVSATHDIADAISNVHIVFVAIPVTYIRSVLSTTTASSVNQTWVLLSKGIEQDTLLLPSQIIKDISTSSIEPVIVSGPSFAYELARKQLTGLVVAHQNQEIAQQIQKVLNCNYVTTTYSSDTIGVQLAGALKNVITIAIGMLDGAGFGDNLKSYVLTKGLQEIAAIITAVGGNQQTAYGLAGVGDVVLTALGKHSKNLIIGKKLGQGESLDQLKKEYSVFPEGINTIASINQLIKKHHVNAPLCSGLYEVVYNNGSLHNFIQQLSHPTFNDATTF